MRAVDDHASRAFPDTSSHCGTQPNLLQGCRGRALHPVPHAVFVFIPQSRIVAARAFLTRVKLSFRGMV